MAFPLLELPAELIASIIEQVQNIKTLHSLATVSRQIQPLAETELYRHAFMRKGSEVAKLVSSLEARPDRTKALQSIDARFQWRFQQGITGLATVLRGCRALREVTIESPCCNNNRWRGAPWWSSMMQTLLRPLYEASILAQEGNVCEKPLQNLTKLTLHLNGDMKEFWGVTGHYSAIFAHPTLLDLTLSSANILEDTSKDLQGIKTPLKRLVLDECNLSIEGLQGILSLPRALETLYIGENHYSEEGTTQPSGTKNFSLCNIDPHGFLLALAQQQHSLQSLHYWLEADEAIKYSPVERPTSDLGLSGFSALTSLTLQGFCPFLLKCLITESAAPPALSDLSLDSSDTTLVLDDADEVLTRVGSWKTLSVSWLTHLARVLPRLRNLRYTLLLRALGFRSEDTWSRTVSATIGNLLRKKGVNLQVLEEPLHSSCVRPILYGEEEAQKLLIYDSARGGVIERQAVSLSDNDDHTSSGSEWEDDDSMDSAE